MTEAEYIVATNLAKLRLAEHALRDVLVMPDGEWHQAWLGILREVAAQILKYEGMVEGVVHESP